ncbi:MAG: kynureninase [bacterium]|nr:kynureninase [bacterium]
MPLLPLGPFPSDAGYATAVALDEADPLRCFRAEFATPDPNLIYLDGNSLGRLPNATIDRLAGVVADEWGDELIRSWPNRWWDLADKVGGQIAPLIGAAADDVIVTDSTSVVLFKLIMGALQIRQGPKQIVTDDLNFPTDLYVADGVARLLGDTEVTVVNTERADPTEAVVAAIDSTTTLVTLSHVAFKSGYLYDMERITSAAHDAGALVLWDLSHSVGVVPIDLRGCAADMAAGCTYKYLNGGPGSPAFLYVAPSLQLDNPLSGWWGHRDPFAFTGEYEPDASIRRFQTGTMPILSLSAIEPSVALVRKAGVVAIRRKSTALTEFFIELCDRLLEPLGFLLASPRDPNRRGSHVSLQHADGWRITQALIDQGQVIPDFRAPDNIRFGFAPLYTSFVDVHTTALRIVELLAAGIPLQYSAGRGSVS